MNFNPITWSPFWPVNISSGNTAISGSSLFENMLYLYMMSGGNATEETVLPVTSTGQHGNNDTVSAGLERKSLYTMLPMMMSTNCRLRTLQMFM